MPGVAVVSDGPKQLCAVGGAGIEQPVGGITQQCKQIDLTKPQTLAGQRIKSRSAKQGAYRDKQ